MKLAPVINTDVKMPARMLDALNRFEAICAVSGVFDVTDADVHKFLAAEYGERFASSFRPEFLFNSPAT